MIKDGRKKETKGRKEGKTEGWEKQRKESNNVKREKGRKGEERNRNPDNKEPRTRTTRQADSLKHNIRNR